MKSNQSLLFVAWKQLLMAYLTAFSMSLVIGTLLVEIGNIEPEAVYEISTKRLSYALPLFDVGTQHGIDTGVLIFVWNSIGALATLSFIYTAAWFNPHHMGRPPKCVRKLFCGKGRMKLFCYLPGCAQIEDEPVRRCYVWLMVPLLGIILLGLESGLSVSTAAYIFGSFFSAFMALLPHGLIEIPTFSLAGAVTYSANLLIDQQAQNKKPRLLFQKIEKQRTVLPIKKIAVGVIGGLFLAGLVEAHVTLPMLNNLLK